jgi:hypothetical protein
MEQPNAEQELRTILEKVKTVTKEEILTGQDLKTILKKMKDNSLFKDWTGFKTMVVNYLKMEWPESPVPSSGELADVCCSVFNDPGNRYSHRIRQYLSKREWEFLIFTLCMSLKEQLENETGK